MATPIDSVNQKQDIAPPETAALRLLDQVHQEMDLQAQTRQAEGKVSHLLNYVYDPLKSDQTRLATMARGLEREAEAGDYGAILAQKKAIGDELARDDKHVSRKATIDFAAADVLDVVPLFASSAVSGAAKWIYQKFEGRPKAGAAANPADAAKAANAADNRMIITPKTDLATSASATDGFTAASFVASGVSSDVSSDAYITKPGDYRESMLVNGSKRSYNVHVPPSYDPADPMPELIMLHGISEDASSFAQLTKMNDKGDQKGFITVYPDGNPLLHDQTHRAWNVPNWDIFHPARYSDDVQFVSQVIDKTPQIMSVNPDKIYLAGFSNGGMLAQAVAAKNSDKLAGVALVGTALSGKDNIPATPVSVIDIHGTGDKVVPYQNWDNSLNLVKMEPVSYTGAFWDAADGIQNPGATQVSGNLTVQDSVNPQTGAEVKQVGVIGGSHTWFGDTNTNDADRSIQATDEIYDFFSHHTRGDGVATVPQANRTITI